MRPNDLTLPAPMAGRMAAEAWLQTASRVLGTRAARFAPFAVSILSGLLYAAAFPPLSWRITAWVSLAPLLAVCASLSPRRAAIAGMCCAASAALGVASFL